MSDIFGFDEREIAEGAVMSLRSAAEDIRSPRCREVLMKCPVLRQIIEEETEALLAMIKTFNQSCRNAEQHLLRLEVA